MLTMIHTGRGVSPVTLILTGLGHIDRTIILLGGALRGAGVGIIHGILGAQVGMIHGILGVGGGVLHGDGIAPIILRHIPEGGPHGVLIRLHQVLVDLTPE